LLGVRRFVAPALEDTSFMNLPAPPTGLYPEDYDRIEAAVMETVRGRWFLLEYARRQRAAETDRLVQAVDRLERYVATRIEEPEATPAGEWRLPRRLAERAREFAATLRASGLDDTLCAQADALADQFAAYAEPAPPAAPETSAAPRVEAPEEAFEAPAPVEENAREEMARQEIAREEISSPEVVALEVANHDIAIPHASASEAIVSEDIAFEEAEWSEPVATQEDEAAVEDVDIRNWEEAARADAIADEIITDPRHAALSRLDHLSLHEKLRLFG
jgi:hypothetical protein